MTNLDSILKSRDITLPTKVHLVKAMCRGPAPVDPGNSKVGTVSASLEITYLITDRKGLED